MNLICRYCAEKRGSFVPEGHYPQWSLGWCDVREKCVGTIDPSNFTPRPDRDGADALATMNRGYE